MVKKINAFNIQKVFVAFALIAFTLFFVGRNDVSASTTSNYYVSDPNSAMYGKVLKLYYDNQGNIIEDTLGIAGDFSEYEIYVNKSKDLITVYGRDPMYAIMVIYMRKASKTARIRPLSI